MRSRASSGSRSGGGRSCGSSGRSGASRASCRSRWRRRLLLTLVPLLAGQIDLAADMLGTELFECRDASARLLPCSLGDRATVRNVAKVRREFRRLARLEDVLLVHVKSPVICPTKKPLVKRPIIGQ